MSLSFYLFRRYFLSSRSTSLIRIVAWICFFGLAISVATLILIISIMGGFGKAIKGRLVKNESHLVVQIKTPLELSAFSKKIHSLQQLKKGIKEMAFLENQDLIVKTSSGFKGVVATGYSKSQLHSKRSNNEMSFTSLEESLKMKGARDVLVSYDFLNEIGVQVGDSITLIPMKALLLPPSMLPPVKKVTVKGIIDEDQHSGNLLFYQQGSLDFGNYSYIKKSAEIKLKNPENYLFYKRLLKDYEVSSWVDRNSTLFFALKLEKLIMVLFIFLAIIISCLGVSSSLFLLMTQKGKDIGILHAMGLSRLDIVKTFTQLGFYLSTLGICLGLFLGILGSAFFKYNTFDLLPSMYEDRTIPAVLDPSSYILVGMGALGLAWLACYLPTKYLSHIKPATLLKITGR